MKLHASKILRGLALLLALHVSAHAGVLTDHAGLWLGDLKLPDGRVLKMGVDIFARADGAMWASFASPDQGSYDMPVTRVQESGDAAELHLPFGALQLNWVDDRFRAEWKQNGASFPLELQRVAQFPRKHRPQTPVAPLSYREETLAISGADGVMLGATLSVPNGVARPSVVILVHGSGPSTRDAEVAGHRLFAVLADHLTRQGVAVLRYDKRGVSRSSGDYEHHTQAQLVDDLAAVVRAIEARKQFDRLGLIGHSEGPMIAAAVSARHPESVDFLVSMAGVGLPGLELMLLQDRMVAQDNGAGPQAVERLMAYVRSYYETIVAHPDPEARVAKLRMLAQDLAADDKVLLEKYRMNRGTLSLGMAGSPMLRALLMTDSRSDWRAVRCPVLALNGSLDRQVPVQSLDGILAALREGGNKQVESAVLPSLNHLFQTGRTGATDKYAALEETISPAVLQRIAAFVGKQH